MSAIGTIKVWRTDAGEFSAECVLTPEEGERTEQVLAWKCDFCQAVFPYIGEMDHLREHGVTRVNGTNAYPGEER